MIIANRSNNMYKAQTGFRAFGAHRTILRKPHEADLKNRTASWNFQLHQYHRYPDNIVYSGPGVTALVTSKEV
jgi:hypothetical protein